MGLPLLFHNYDLADTLSKSLLLAWPQLLTHFISQLFLFTAVLILLGWYWLFTLSWEKHEPWLPLLYTNSLWENLAFSHAYLHQILKRRHTFLIYFPGSQVLFRWQRKCILPTMIFNSPSNSRNSFQILTNGWLGFSWQCSYLCLFLCLHWHFYDKLKETYIIQWLTWGCQLLKSLSIIFKNKNWGTLWTDLALAIELVVNE